MMRVADVRVDGASDPKGVRERMGSALRRVLNRFRADLRDPLFLRTLAARSPTSIATVDDDDHAYVLWHVPVRLSKALSGREVDVVRLVGESLSNKEIAGKLHLSPPTISAHLERIYSKLGVHTRVALARLAIGLPYDTSGDAVKT